MNYTAKNIDIERFMDAMNVHKEAQCTQQQIAIEKAKARYDGYCACIGDVLSMLQCSNYENPVKSSADYMAGVDAFIYEVCKELGIDSTDLRGSKTSTDEKAAILSNKIRELFGVSE